MTLRGWGWTNGVSEELNHGRDTSAKAAEETADDELRAEFRAAQERLQAQIDEISDGNYSAGFGAVPLEGEGRR